VKRLLSALGASIVTLSALALEPGQAAPGIDLIGKAGPVKLSDFKGKAVYLDFWASWCGPCKQSFPWMSEMQTKYGGKGFQVLAVNLDQKADDATTFLKENSANFAIAYDPSGQSARQYGIKGMPSSVLIGRDGKVTHFHTGFGTNSRTELERAIVVALETGK
jgi:thiol-disulfide isomerase/thioredoxin